MASLYATFKKLVLAIAVAGLLAPAYAQHRGIVSLSEQLNRRAAAIAETDPFKALALAERAGRIGDSLADRRAIFYSQRNQAIIRVSLGQLQEAEGAATKAIVLARILEQDSLIAAGLGTLGYIQMNRQDGRNAAKTLAEALIINNRLRRMREVGRNQLNLGIVRYYFGNKQQEGLALIQQARRWAKANADYQLLNNTLSNLASISFSTGHREEALALNAESRQINQKTGNVNELVFALNQAARFELEMGKLHLAQARIADAITRVTHTNLEPTKACTYNTAADVYEALGNASEALALFRRSTSIYDSLEVARRARLTELSQTTMKSERDRMENEQLRLVRAQQKESIMLQRTVIVLICLVLVAVVVLLVVAGRSNAKVRALLDKLKEQNKDIVRKKEEIQKLNAGLEMTVLERTSKLDQRTRQILEYASYNSHIIRGPLARILGLAYLLQHAESDEDVRIYTRKMEESAKEMDHAIQTVNRKLELEELAQYLPVQPVRRIRPEKR